MIQILLLGVTAIIAILLAVACAQLSEIKAKLELIHREINNWRYRI